MLQIVTYLVLVILAISVVSAKITGEEYALMPPVFNVEDYDSCMLMGQKALYCYVKFELQPLDPRNESKTWQIIKEVSSSPLRYRHDLIRHFVCVSKTCPDLKTEDASIIEFNMELGKCLNRKYVDDGMHGVVKYCKCKTSKPVYDVEETDFLVALIFLGYLLFITIASLYDLKERYQTMEDYKQFKNTRWGWLVTSFSIPNNWEKLKNIPTGSDFEKLKSIQGIRVFMTIVVIGVHTCLLCVVLPVSNPQWFEESNENPDFISNIPRRGIFLLSFHFMTSSWILMNSLLAKNDKNEEISLEFMIKSVIKRYLRFLPSVAVIVAFFATWFRHLPFGPFGFGVCEESERCRQNWWTNILFIQNHVNRYFMCHIVSWYLAVEMQYYILSLLLIKLLLKLRNKIPVAISLMIVINIIFVYLDHYRHGYPSTLAGTPEEMYQIAFNKKSQWHDHFASYHGNFAGTLVGLIFGYYYYTFKNDRLFTNKISIVMWWITTFSLLTSVLCLPLIINMDKTPMHSAAWVAVTRPIFSIGMGLLVLGLSHGAGGFVKWVCDWPPLQYLAKLSYCVYISHTVLQSIRAGLQREPVYLNYYASAITAASDVLVSFLVAVPLTLLFEMPANELANSLFKAKRTGEKKKD